MADEIMTAPEEQALFQLSNGRYIMDEAQSRVMFQIKEAQPEHSHPISGTIEKTSNKSRASTIAISSISP